MKNRKSQYLIGAIVILLLVMIATKPSKEDFIDYTNTIIELKNVEKSNFENPLINRSHAKTRDYLIFCEYRVRYVSYFESYGFDVNPDIQYSYITYYGILGNFYEKD